MFDGVNKVADHIVVIVEMVLVKLALVATRDVASGLKSLALLRNLKGASLRVAASKEGITHLGVSRRLSLLVNKFGAANGVAQLKNVRHVRAGGALDRVGERCGRHAAGTLDLLLKAFCQRSACPFAGERKQLGMLGEPGSGVDILLCDGAQRVVVQATTFDLGDKANHLADVLRGHIGRPSAQGRSKGQRFEQPIKNLLLVQAGNKRVGRRTHEVLGIARPDAACKSVKRTDFDAVGVAPNELNQAFAHGFRARLGIGEAEDVARGGIAVGQDVRRAQAH